jgi:hypothetical protein
LSFSPFTLLLTELDCDHKSSVLGSPRPFTEVSDPNLIGFFLPIDAGLGLVSLFQSCHLQIHSDLPDCLPFIRCFHEYFRLPFGVFLFRGLDLNLLGNFRRLKNFPGRLGLLLQSKDLANSTRQTSPTSAVSGFKKIFIGCQADRGEVSH